MISTIWENKITRKITAVAFWVAVWFIIAAIVDNPLLVASPIHTLLAFWNMLLSGELAVGVAGSLIRIMLGFIAGVLVAFVLAVLSYCKESVQVIVSPFMNLCKAVPVAAFAVILIIWWGPDKLSLLISMIVVLPLVYSNILEGLKSSDNKLLEMAKVLDVPARNKIFFIYRPALAPFVIAAFKSGIGMCWKAGVAAEVIGLCSSTIGGGMYSSKVYFETASVFAWAGVTVAVSYAMEKLVLYVVDKLLKGQYSCTARNRNVTGDSTLNIVGLHKAYGEKVIYQDYNHRFVTGEENRLDGASGSGKTTLLRIIAGLEKCSGTIECRGIISMMFQEDRLCEDYNAVTNVALTGVDEVKAKEALLMVLDEDSVNKPCRELSGGMKRRVALVRAMECPADIVLLDEPFTGLDEDTLKVVKDYIEQRKQSRTIIVASHIL